MLCTARPHLVLETLCHRTPQGIQAAKAVGRGQSKATGQDHGAGTEGPKATKAIKAVRA